MKPIHIPRSLIIGILLAISLVFLLGTLRAFASVKVSLPVTGGTMRLAAAAGPTEEPVASGETVSTPAPVTPPSADTTGIIILAIVIVAIVLFGTVWGVLKPAAPKK